MRAAARWGLIAFPSTSISNSDTRAHFIPRTVLPATVTAFLAASAKLFVENPTTSVTFCTIEPPRDGIPDALVDPSPGTQGATPGAHRRIKGGNSYTPSTRRDGASVLEEISELIGLQVYTKQGVFLGKGNNLGVDGGNGGVD